MPSRLARFAALAAVMVLGAHRLTAQAVADTVVPTETVARLQLEDGTLTLTARGDGRVTVAVLRLAPLDVAAADFSIPTLRAFVTTARGTDAAATAGPATMLNSIDDRMAIGIDRRMPPMVIALRGRERVSVVLRLTAEVTADTVAAVVERAVERSREMTTGFAPALVDATDATILRMERSRQPITAAATPVVPTARTGWSKADRGYFILMGALVGGVAASAVAAGGDSCWDRVPCTWEQGAPGPVIVGSIAMSTIAGVVTLRSGGCAPGKRFGRAAMGAVAGAIPGAVLALRGERAGLLIVPIGQLAAIMRLTNECANPPAGS